MEPAQLALNLVVQSVHVDAAPKSQEGLVVLSEASLADASASRPRGSSPLPTPLAVVLPSSVSDKVLSLLILPSIPPLIQHFFYRHLNLLDCDPGILIPSYMVDIGLLSHLATILFVQDDAPSVFGPQLPAGGPTLVPYSDSDSDDDEVVVIEGPITSATPKKRRARKLKEPIYSKFPRRSFRLNQGKAEFRTKDDALTAAAFPSFYSAETQDAFVVALYLPIDSIQGMATGFLRIQPSVVFVAALLDLDLDDDASSM
jgi:hypothetical protein